jgi:transketolase
VSTTTERPAGWTALDDRAVTMIRGLAMDAVEKVGNGHPGTAMSLAPLAYHLYQHVLRHDPADDRWVGRDRFVLSAGHSSLTLYIQLYLSGYGLQLDDLEAFRTWGSLTPGHPEYRHTKGVETTTGPLGQGLANAVGMAMAARRERGLFDPDAAAGESPFDHHVYVIASDGDMEEGITSEASSIAGTQQLGNLLVIWDDNHISIEDDTAIALSEDTLARYAAYGWHTQLVDELPTGEADVTGFAAAVDAARAVTDRPSFIAVRTVIGWPAPNLRNTGKAHGSALGAAEVAATKEILGLDPQVSFQVDPEVLAHARLVKERGAKAHAEWDAELERWRSANPDRAALFDRLFAGERPAGWTDAVPTFPADPKGMATRKASGEVLNALGPVLPELWGGSADLAESNNTTIEGAPSFLPSGIRTRLWGAGDPYGRTLHFGIREHAMGAILNGIAVHGPTRPYGGTFLVFSDYMRGAVRLASLMQVPVTYVWTHDSIGLGEDGPTHQPIEHLSALRAIPGLSVVRPCDANETAVAWRTILSSSRPVGLALTRQNVPTLDRAVMAPADGLARGGYVLAEASADPEVILIGTGSEVHLAVSARESLEADGIPTRVVSMPCVEWFDEQDAGYRESVLPASVRARVSVEAGVTMTWHRFVGDAGRCIGIEHFGASADAATLFREFGFTVEAVVAAAHASLTDTRA